MSNDPQQRPENRKSFDTDAAQTQAIHELAEATAEALQGSSRFSPNELFELLSDPGRRYVLTYLLQSEGYVTCSELVDHVEAATDHTMTDKQFRERIVAKMTHCHLPKLAEKGFVEYNTERQIVSPTAKTPIVRPYLRLALAQEQLAAERE